MRVAGGASTRGVNGEVDDGGTSVLVAGGVTSKRGVNGEVEDGGRNAGGTSVRTGGTSVRVGGGASTLGANPVPGPTDTSYGRHDG